MKDSVRCRKGSFGRLQSTLNWSSGGGIRGEIILSLGQRKCKIEKNWVKVGHAELCNREGQKKPAEVSPSWMSELWGNTWHWETTPVNRTRSHKTLWGISYLPSLITNTPLVMAAVQVTARRRHRTHLQVFYRIPWTSCSFVSSKFSFCWST